MDQKRTVCTCSKQRWKQWDGTHLLPLRKWEGERRRRLLRKRQINSWLKIRWFFWERKLQTSSISVWLWGRNKTVRQRDSWLRLLLDRWECWAQLHFSGSINVWSISKSSRYCGYVMLCFLALNFISNACSGFSLFLWRFKKCTELKKKIYLTIPCDLSCWKNIIGLLDTKKLSNTYIRNSQVQWLTYRQRIYLCSWKVFEIENPSKHALWKMIQHLRYKFGDSWFCHS